MKRRNIELTLVRTQLKNYQIGERTSIIISQNNEGMYSKTGDWTKVWSFIARTHFHLITRTELRQSLEAVSRPAKNKSKTKVMIKK